MSANQMSKMVKARGRLTTNHVFYASLIFQTKFIIDNTIPTAATDMVKVWYNEKFIESLEVPVVMFVIVHEICHIIFKHGLRRGTRNRLIWNWACDFAINIILHKAGFTLWEHCIHKRCPIDGALVNHTGKTAEVIYEELMKKLQSQDKKPEDFEPGEGSGDLMEPGVTDEASQAEIERRINRQVSQAWATAKMAGKLPAGLDLMIENILYPPHPWEDVLQEFMQRVVQVHETWQKRNRRYSSIFMPSRGGRAFGELVVIGDTSGSMLGKNTLNRVGSEINGARQQMMPETTRVIWADAVDCSRQEVFGESEEMILRPAGGGGTDMRLALKFAEQYDPRCVILLTDGYSPWDKEPPPYPLIIGCTTNVELPDYAMVVRITV